MTFSPSKSNRKVDLRLPFRRLNSLLNEFLQDLVKEDWSRPTIHSNRNVKDLVAHLLAGTLQRLSRQRDGFPFSKKVEPLAFQELVELIQGSNVEWINAMKRLSPRLLIELIQKYDNELLDFFDGIDLDAEAPFGVAWAGEDVSANWFDIAREYTEKWHHQQQLRDATNHPPLYDRDLFLPTLQTFALGFPFALQKVRAQEGDSVSVNVSGIIEESWSLQYKSAGWVLLDIPMKTSATSLTIDSDAAWRIWTKGVQKEQIVSKVIINGNHSFSEAILNYVAIMA